MKIEDLNLDFSPKIKVLNVSEPPQRKAGVKVIII